ncbi:MAG TPA: GNAT family N-acetyltransferase [Chryseolinea sp.]|nr:GNAT family N-acetyltransferase [Chryseolinea sp.]
MNITLRPIKERMEDNIEFINNPSCDETLEVSVQFYAMVGYSFPWVGYYAFLDDIVVGSAGFKGRPMGGQVEIAYGTQPAYRKQGIGTEICRLLVQLALQTDPTVIVTARTLPQENYSTHILLKNKFVLKGEVMDLDDGKVWEWRYEGRVKSE